MKALRAWMRRHWFLSSLILFLACWRLFWWHFYTPIRNPWPQQAYTVKGRFPFDKGFDLVFAQHVYGAAHWHQRVCGVLSLTDSALCSADRVFFKPRRIDGQHYEITLYRDYYLPGLPGWTLYAVNEWPMAFKDGVGFDYEKTLATSIREIPAIVCSDEPESLQLFKGKLFCMEQYQDESRNLGYVKYMHLRLPLSSQPRPGEKIRDFWLSSELDAMLVEEAAK